MKPKVLAAAAALALVACAYAAAPAQETEYGASPQLAEPRTGLIPTLNARKAIGWSATAGPTAPEGFTVVRYAEGLEHPRWLYLLPNGDVLVAEAATQPAKGGGIMGWIRTQVQKHAGAITENANRITLLRDADGDGRAEVKSVFAENLNQPFGMALVGDALYIANTDSVMRYHYQRGATRLEGAGEKILDIPYNEGANGHWTRGLLVAPDNTHMFLSVGSVSNVADNGMEIEQRRAAIWRVALPSGQARVFATGLRNPIGMDFEPSSGALWASVNERDMLGDALVPDYITSVREGAFYGWPYSYFGQNVDTRVEPQNPDLVARAVKPDYAMGAHTAVMGLRFYRGNAFPQRYRGGAFVAQHGSWNRNEPSGYKVVFVPFENGRPAADTPEDFLTGFLNDANQAQGRPVGVIEDGKDALLVADDVGDIIWRIAPNGLAR